MIPKGSALYLHAPKGCYDCDDCPFFVPSSGRCVLHSPNDHISAEGSCGYFVPGVPEQFGFVPLSFLTKEESGYAENVNEASCKRCKAWSPEGWDCSVVDKDSPGDDAGIIHPDACCALWTKDPDRGDLPEQYFTSHGYVERSV